MKLNKKDLYNLEGLKLAGSYSDFEIRAISDDILELSKRTPFSFKGIVDFIKNQIHRLEWNRQQIIDSFHIVEKEMQYLHTRNVLSLE